MKTIQFLLSFFFLFIISAFAQTPLQGTIPDKLAIGKTQVLEKLADATRVTVECSAPGMKTFKQTVGISGGVDSIDDIANAVESIQVQIGQPTDPTVEIFLGAWIEDAVGDVQFEAVQTFKLEKVYGKSGPSYQIPPWVGSLYFWLANRGIYFPDAQFASFVGKDFEFALEVKDGWIAAGYFGNGFLKVVTSSGTYYYDWNTGIRVSHESYQNISEVAFEDIQKIYEGNVYRTLYPEWNYVPWLQVKAPADGVITLNVFSVSGFTPIGVSVRSLEDLRAGTEPLPQSYVPGMTLKVKPGQTVYVWFDFSDWVWGLGSENGKGG